MRADQREEGGQEGAARRPCAFGDHAHELGNLQAQEARAEDKGDDRPKIGRAGASPLYRKGEQAAGEARKQETAGLDQHVGAIKELRSGRTAGRTIRQHRIGGEQRREDHDVAQQEKPEAEAHHHLDGGGSPFRDRYLVVAFDRPRERVGNTHAVILRRARSVAAICSGEISISSSTRQAWTRPEAAMPSAPTIANHQMCQTSAKPATTEKKERKNPTALLEGMWIGSQWVSSVRCAASLPASFMPQ